LHDAVRFTHACPLVPGAIAAGGFVADPALARHIPLGRLGRSEDLCTDGAGGAVEPALRLCHGAAIVVDGGLSLMNWFEPPELGDM